MHHKGRISHITSYNYTSQGPLGWGGNIIAPYRKNNTYNHTSQGNDPLGWGEVSRHHIGRISHITVLLRDPLKGKYHGTI